ncbi:MAG: hypothetical protein LQ344_000307 [Seirophora lacunosa]|nr:MAG: hypothetical protein LQ344_000307 [Seirophora lacunosa]
MEDRGYFLFTGSITYNNVDGAAMDLPPAPTYEFYIPSIHDDTALACRIYSAPEAYFGGGSPDLETNREKPWAPKGAVVAHPYSSLGGSYDDSTVLHVVSALLKRRFTVGTFNFREAHMRHLQTPFDRKETKNSWPDREMGFSPSEEDFIPQIHVPTPKTHYLLISLLLEPLAAFCTGFRKLGSLDIEGDSLDEKFSHNATLVVHGKKDRLTSMAKIEKWADWRKVNSAERFKIVGVANSGHFWRDEKPIKALKVAIRTWVQEHVREESE